VLQALILQSLRAESEAVWFAVHTSKRSALLVAIATRINQKAPAQLALRELQL